MNRIPVILIAAMNSLEYIGKDGDLIVKCSRDLQRFKELSKNGVVIMGRKTYESLPVFLPGRSIVVVTGKQKEDLSHPKNVDEQNLLLVRSTAHAMQAAERLAAMRERERIVIAGGESVYAELMPQVDEAHLTHFDDEEMGDARFPMEVLKEFINDGRLMEETGQRFEFFDGEMKVRFVSWIAQPMVENKLGDWVVLRTGHRFRLSSLHGYILQEDSVAFLAGSAAFSITNTEANPQDLMDEMDRLIEEDAANVDRRIESASRRAQTMQLVNQ